MNTILAMMSDAGGKPSQMRMMSLLAVIIVLGTWAIVSVQNQALQPLSAEAVAVVTVAFGSKVWQTTKELSNAEATKPTQ